jgi:hypothetical protein
MGAGYGQARVGQMDGGVDVGGPDYLAATVCQRDANGPEGPDLRAVSLFQAN